MGMIRIIKLNDMVPYVMRCPGKLVAQSIVQPAFEVRAPYLVRLTRISGANRLTWASGRAYPAKGRVLGWQLANLVQRLQAVYTRG